MMCVFGLIDSGEHHLWRETKRGGHLKCRAKKSAVWNFDLTLTLTLSCAKVYHSSRARKEGM